MATIIQTLQNAQYNLVTNSHNTFARVVGDVQMSNAINMLMKRYPPDTDVEKTLDKHEVTEVADLPDYDK
jgi:hypothetical protein